MTLSEIFGWSGGGILVLMCLLQISPIEIDPWSWLAKKIGRALNGEVLTKVGKLEKGLEDVKKSIAEEEAITCRVRILRFGDECRQGLHHSKDYFDQILGDITVYEHYCQQHSEFANNITAITSDFIKEIYRNELSKEKDGFQ